MRSPRHQLRFSKSEIRIISHLSQDPLAVLVADEVGFPVPSAPGTTLTTLGSIPLADSARLDVGAVARRPGPGLRTCLLAPA